MSVEIVVNIDPKGEVVVEVEGAKGGSCTNLTSALEAALGASGGKEFKREFYEQDQQIRINR
jgi:hypothetical protein